MRAGVVIAIALVAGGCSTQAAGPQAPVPAVQPPGMPSPSPRDSDHRVPASGAAAFPHRAVVGPTLHLSPTSGPYGTLIHLSGTVVGVRDCPAVRITLAADSATGAASGSTDAVLRLDPGGADLGSWRADLRLPDTRLSGRTGPPVLRASCERLDHHATNVGAEPVVAFSVAG